MPFIQRSQIDSKIRAPYERKYKIKLREALRNPGLTEKQKKAIKDKIRSVSSNEQ